MLDLLALACGLGLTWGLGLALVGAAGRLGAAGDTWPLAWRIGLGWFVGVLATTLVMRIVSAAGPAFGVAAVGAPMLAIAALAAWLALRGRPAALRGALREAGRSLRGGDLEGWQRLAWQLIVAWLALRFALLFAEVWWRPLYPWDAWTQWATKGRAWFEMRTMVPFAGAVEWLTAPPAAQLWYDAAPHYPGTMPLMQTWSALLIGRWDDALVNLPWWLTGVALLVALVGALQLLGFGRLPALVAAALVLTLPIVNVHIALAGYADLPMACYVTLGTVAVLRVVRTRNAGDAAVALALLVALVLVKNPGKAWVFMLLPAFIVAALPRHGLRIAAAMFAVAFFALLVAARSGISLLGYHFTLQYAMPWGALFDAYFSFANWNLLWYAAVAVVALGWRQLFAGDVAPFTVAVAGGLLFLFIGFAFTNAGAWVEDQSTVNRATLHLAPLVVVWMFVCVRAWLRDVRPALPAPATP
ncbi:MAG TPA: hypothetical protein VFX05_04255 [Casimicrobiaceae bacterium]|nr:hypothetical protein [Casimicrobiaceae bacterium]